MKTTRKLLTLLLVLALTLSLAVTVSAQENGDTAPYLSYRELRNDEEGWYEPMGEEPRTGEDGMMALDWVWRIYYLNTWDEENGEWKSEPVMIDEDHPNLTVEKLLDLEDEYIREGEPNADYFCKITSANSMEHQETEVHFEQVSMTFTIYAREAGFYTSDTPSIESAILTWEYLTDVLREEDSFYYIFHSGYWQEVEDSFFYWVTTWDENQEMVRVEGEAANDFITVEPKGDGVFKIIVNPDFVRMTTGNWANFEVVCGVEAQGDDEQTTFERRIWINPSGSHDNFAARFSIDGKEYLFYEDSDIVGTWEPQYEENGDPVVNDWGDHVHYWTRTRLPEGVSYNLANNTLTLNNARLENLHADYHWANRNENGEIIIRDDGTREEGWNLPNADLKINLRGSNEIVNAYGPALDFESELNVTINGTGSLLAKAINSTENTRTEYHWDGENEVEMEVYHNFDAIHVNNGSNLTIAGNAKVTAEIEGAAYETVWDENGPTDRYENAYLSAVRVNEGDLTLKDNATLTTVLPENARDNGYPVAESEEFSGGYRGVENFRNLTIQDKATLTTSSLHISNGWQWNEETERHEITWTGTYNQTGGKVNITALGQYGKNMTDDGELIDHYHYSGLRTDFGEINISGGILNVTAAPADEEAAVSAWAQAIGVNEGKLNISGGTVNAEVRYGQAIGIPCGDAVISGGTVNLNTYDGIGISTGEWEDDPNDDYNPDGTLTIDGGTVNIESKDSGYPTSAIELLVTTKSFVINDGELNIENGMFDIFGTLDINGGRITLEAETSQNYYGAFGAAGFDSAVNMRDGELNINTTNYYMAMVNDGAFTQTGGSITINATATGEWRAAHTETDEEGNVTYAPEVYGVISGGSTKLSGGTMTVNSVDYGFYQDANWIAYVDEEGNAVATVDDSRKLEVSGEAVLNITGRTNALKNFGVVDIKGGSVNAEAINPVDGDMAFAFWTSSNAGTYQIHTEDGPLPYEMENTASVSITGGTHSFVAPTTSIRGTGFFSVFCPVTIENATVKVVGGRSLFDVAQTEEGNLSGSWYIISLKSGEELELLRETNTIEENGERFTETVHFLEEDNILGNAEDTYDFATEALILPDNKCGDNAYWEIDDGVLTVYGEGAMYDYAPVDFEQGLSTAPWIAVKDVIEKVVVEEGITTVGAFSFAWLENVTHISFPASLEEIRPASVIQTGSLAGYTVASGCERYASPDGISIVDLKESRLHTVAMAAPGKTYTVPQGVTVIGGVALQLCGFEEVIIPEGVTEIQVAVFEGCANLKTVTIPKSVTKLDEAIFVGCGDVTVKVYCETAGEAYVEENGINCEVIHEYADATCTDPRTCKVCKATEGEKLGHKWGQWETGADGKKTRTCSVCKETETDEPDKPHVSTCPKDDTCPLSAYVDLNAGDWYHEGIHYCIDNGLMNGMSANTFEAGGFTTRAQLVTILYRAAGQPDISGLSEPFSDVSEADWYYKAIVWAYNNQVVNGMTADTFAPNGNVTREQVATILYRYTDSPMVSGSLAGFPDAAAVSGYAQTSMVWATDAGLINGVMQPDGTSLLDPTGNATRAQIATILMRYLANG